MLYIPEERAQELLEWDKVYDAVEDAMKSVAENRTVQPGRTVMQLGNSSNLCLIMPGYVESAKCKSLGCKMFTIFPENARKTPPVSDLIANIFLFNPESGALEGVVAGNEITNWRTAAASVVATKHLHGGHSGKENNILTVIGAGSIGRLHAIAFWHFFKFNEVRIWNRTPQRARNLADELNNKYKTDRVFVAYDNIEECCKNADVIVTATNSSQTLVKFDWIKKGAHINAVGVNRVVHELDDATYRGSNVYIDYWVGARNELDGIEKLGVEFKAQIGDLIVGNVAVPNSETTTVFQSLGMAVEDCVVARLVYDLHLGNRV